MFHGFKFFIILSFLSWPSLAFCQETHSGLPIPRFASLKYNIANARRGPGEDHPVVWKYTRKNLPLQVIAETRNWRRIRDMDGDEAWVHKRLLEERRYVVTLGETFLRYKPLDQAKPRAIAEGGVLLRLLDPCQKDGWCHVKTEKGRKGWMRREVLWGVEPAP